jgi:hypothetical protein
MHGCRQASTAVSSAEQVDANSFTLSRCFWNCAPWLSLGLTTTYCCMIDVLLHVPNPRRYAEGIAQAMSAVKTMMRMGILSGTLWLLTADLLSLFYEKTG